MHRSWARAVAVSVAVALGLGACSQGDETGRAATSGDVDRTTATAPARPISGAPGPARHTGPQGRVGQFVVHCTYSHSGAHDPIVHPGHEGRSHQHDFYGAVEVDSDTEAEALLGGGTTCDKRADTASYWQPALFDRGEVVAPTGIAAYYRAAPGVDPGAVDTIPVGLALIAGDQTATAPQPGEAVGWVCGSRTALHDAPPPCPRSAPLRLVLTFQDCWDGVHLDSADHTSHAAYSLDGRCPDSHPVHLPQLTVAVMFPVWGPDHELTLASGSVHSAHGDFLNAWDPAGLQREIEQCIHRDVVCDLASNREEEPLFTG